VCVDVVGVEISASVKASEDVCWTGGVETAGGTVGATDGVAAGAETVALVSLTGTAIDLGIF
jgi:hypothetical protein